MGKMGGGQPLAATPTVCFPSTLWVHCLQRKQRPWGSSRLWTSQCLGWCHNVSTIIPDCRISSAKKEKEVVHFSKIFHRWWTMWFMNYYYYRRYEDIQSVLSLFSNPVKNRTNKCKILPGGEALKRKTLEKRIFLQSCWGICNLFDHVIIGNHTYEAISKYLQQLKAPLNPWRRICSCIWRFMQQILYFHIWILHDRHSPW